MRLEQRMPCGAVDLVPLGAAQRDVSGATDIRQAIGRHRARDQLDIGGVAKDPRGRRLRK